MDVKDNTRRVTPEELVEIAAGIWKEIHAAKVPVTDGEGCKRLLETMQQEHRDFSESFPVVLKWMVMLRRYDQGAFRKYLDLHAKMKQGSKDAFFELQADYLKLLERAEKPHADEKILNKFRARVVTSLTKENREFEKTVKEVDSSMKEEKALFEVERKRALLEKLRADKKARGGPEPVRPPLEIPCRADGNVWSAKRLVSEAVARAMASARGAPVDDLDDLLWDTDPRIRTALASLAADFVRVYGSAAESNPEATLKLHAASIMIALDPPASEPAGEPAASESAASEPAAEPAAIKTTTEKLVQLSAALALVAAPRAI